MASQAQIDQYRDEGYFIVDDLVDPGQLDALATAAERVADKVRTGAVVDDPAGIRTGGPGQEPQFVCGLIAPEFAAPEFATYLGSQGLARYLKPFIGDDLRLGWVHLCAVRGPYSCHWHRDTGGNRGDGGYDKEMALLASYRRHFMKWHTALVDDPYLWIVPGSQRRYRTDLEYKCMADGQSDLPGARQIVLRQGQTAFWNGNSIHRGFKPADMGDRMTLMGALIDHRAPYDASEKGDQPWLMADSIRAALPPRAQRYYDNWRSLAVPRLAGGAA